MGLTENDLCAVQFALQALQSIADRKRMVVDVIEPVNDIRAASRLAKEAVRRFEPVAVKLLDSSSD